MNQFMIFCSTKRVAWLLLALTAFALELIALYFQIVLLLNPCVLCTYQRYALYGIVVAGLLGAMAPNSPLLRFFGLTIWLYSAWQGLILAIKHTDIQLHPSTFVTCKFFINFPFWLPFGKQLPSNDCTVHQWHFCSMKIPQWLILIFSVYLAVAAVMFISQCLSTCKRYFFNKK
ncbi:Disulfide bond formation protein B [Candidatus Moranella endobia PCVAL]|uniref:disulfide bond formation protein DsbB n=1 Tax=Candidatus Moranella endobia TaxID=1048758 RepID=UPI0002C6A19E|nr:disulfide bond formation protein DsbB [Candidatus Moranella endobia]AGJ61472.1 Disulfide bond formation protein B [Candidatus Moranella endobia PCVAL]